MIVISIILSLLYLLLVSSYIFGWIKTKNTKVSQSISNHFYSIIIPSRNEESNILQTLQDLKNQDFDQHRFEVIVVNDFSEDRTVQICEDFYSLHQLDNFKLVELDEKDKAGKKQAISKGISIAQGDWIITTDADCRRGKNWLRAFDSKISNQEFVFVAGPVCFDQEESSFEKIQSLEFISLVGIGAANISNKMPTMCNGANMAFKKDVFGEVGGYSGNDQIASGDDSYLLQKVALKYKNQIAFLKSKEAIVRTHAKKTLKEFLEQRKRWVSKSSQHNNLIESLMSYFVWGFHVFGLVLLIISYLGKDLFISFSILMSVKLISELIFVLVLSNFYSKRKIMLFYIPAAFLYLIYVSMIAPLSFSKKLVWKGRVIK